MCAETCVTDVTDQRHTRSQQVSIASRHPFDSRLLAVSHGLRPCSLPVSLTALFSRPLACLHPLMPSVHHSNPTRQAPTPPTPQLTCHLECRSRPPLPPSPCPCSVASPTPPHPLPNPASPPSHTAQPSVTTVSPPPSHLATPSLPAITPRHLFAHLISSRIYSLRLAAAPPRAGAAILYGSVVPPGDVVGRRPRRRASSPLKPPPGGVDPVRPAEADARCGE